MLEELREYLNDCVSPEEVQLFSESSDILDSLAVQTADFGFNQILMMDDNSDPGETQLSIRRLFQDLITNLIRQHGVEMTDDADLSIRNKVLSGLVALENYDDPQSIVRITEQSLNANEILGQILNHLNGVETTEYLIAIDFVSQMLIQNIKDMMNDLEYKTVDNAERVMRDMHLDKFRRFCDFMATIDTEEQIVFKRRQSDIQLLIKKGMDAAFPFQMYIDLIGRDFEAMTPMLAASNLLGMAILSSDGFENPTEKIGQFMDLLISDTNLVTKVTMTVSNLWVRFNQHESS